MAAIPPQFIESLLERADIAAVIGDSVDLKRIGPDRHRGLCPFHNEKTPSFHVHGDRRFFYCFGCREGGDCIAFLQKHRHLSFVEAVETLAARFGMEVPRARQTPEQARRRARRKTLYEMMAEAAAHYQKRLGQSDAARAYLARRGISDKTAKAFGIGYAPDRWDDLIKATGTTAERRAMLQRAGLIKSGRERNYDHFRHRLMFPIEDLRGRVLAFGGRTVDDADGADGDARGAKYINSPETEIFHKGRELYGLRQALQGSGDPPYLLLVEGYADVVLLAEHGIKGALASMGTAFGAAHLQLMFRYSPRIIFGFDGDAAGRRAARAALDLCVPAMRDGRQLCFWQLPDGEDPDSLVRKRGAEFVRQQLRDAMPLSEYLLRQARQGCEGDTPEQRASFCKNALQMIDRVPGAMLRAAMLELLSERSGLSLDDMQRAAPAAAPAPRQPEPPPQTPAPAAAMDQRMQRIACLLLLHPQLHALARQMQPPQGSLLHQILALLGQHPDCRSPQLHGLLCARGQGAALDALVRGQPWLRHRRPHNAPDEERARAELQSMMQLLDLEQKLQRAKDARRNAADDAARRAAERDMAHLSVAIAERHRGCYNDAPPATAGQSGSTRV